MDKLDEKILEKYFDGELSDRESQKMEELIQHSKTSQVLLDKNQRVGDLIRLMEEEQIKGVPLAGLSDRVLRLSQNASPPPFSEKLRVWFSEFINHRQAVWIPAAAVGAVVLTLLFLPFSITSQKGTGYEADNGIALHTASPSKLGSQIASVDFGSANGTTYNLRNEEGASVGVVWIEETP